MYCAPTSGGKSLVSDILLIRRLTRNPGRIGVLVLPFVALCRERAEEMERALGPGSRIPVRRFFGGGGGRLPPPDGGGGLLVCTPEKFNDIMTRLIEQDRTHELCSVVVDELHMVQDPSRGGTLELALTKLLFASAKAASFFGTSPSGTTAAAEEMRDRPMLLTEPSGATGDSSQAARGGPQIIGMSATLADVDGLARWFDAKLFETNFRPVPLRVHVVTGNEVFQLPGRDGDDRGPPLSPLGPSLNRESGFRVLPEGGETDHVVVELVREAVAEDGDVLFPGGKGGGGVIVFCAAKFQCETTASLLATRLANAAGLADPASDARSDQPRTSRAALVDALRRLQPKAADTEKKLTLATCASRGVVWHHSALRAEEKALVERGFREGVFRAVCCTTTMAAGVNLPSKRVVIANPYYYRKRPNLHEILNSRDLQQMVGRAGRAGFGSSFGDAFVVCPRPSEVRWPREKGPRDPETLALEYAERLVSSGESLSSTLAHAGMRRVMLEAVACGLARDPSDIKRYVQCTLLNALNDFQDVVAKGATDALRWLAERGFLRWDAETQKWNPSPLGRAAAAAHLDPDRAVAVVEDVRKARRCLILETDLHLLFLCVPPDPPAAADEADSKPSKPSAGSAAPAARGGPPAADDECWLNREVFCKIYGRLNEHERVVANAVGITESYYNRLACGKLDRTGEHRNARRICHRFLRALALHDVVCERDVGETAEAFGMSPGTLAQTQESAARHAGQVAAVCGPMGWGDVEALVTRLQDRIAAGAKEEILSLTSISGIGASRARALYAAGFRTPEDILKMSLRRLAELLEGSATGHGKGQMGAARAIMRGAERVCLEQRRAAREESEAQLRELQKLGPISALAVGEESAFGFRDDEEIECTQNATVGILGDGPRRGIDPVVSIPKFPEFDPATATGAVAVRHPEALETLEAFWRAAPAYAFVLRPGTRAVAGGRGAVASPPVAIALAFPSNPSATFYAPVVARGGSGGGDACPLGDADADWNDDAPSSRRRGYTWETVRSILGVSGTEKCTVDLKPQLRAMGAANAAVSASSRSVRERSETSIGRVAPPCVDVRVAGWLLRSEATALRCGVDAGWARLADGGGVGGPTEALSRAFAGEIDSESIRRASTWPFPFNESPFVETSRIRRNHAAAAATTMAAATVLAVDSVIRARLTSEGFEDAASALERVEMPLVPVLASMESEGVPFEPELLRRQIKRANARLLELETRAAEMMEAADAAPVSLASSADVARALFEILALPPPPCAAPDGEARGGVPGRRRRQRFKTDSETLLALRSQHPFPALVLEHRSLSKRLSAAEELVDAARRSAAADGTARLRGSIHQTNTETGRLAMEEPNLQTIPHSVSIVQSARANPAGSVASSDPDSSPPEPTFAIRGAFRAPRGRVLLAADYAQLELRVAAHFSEDEVLLTAFKRHQDPFRALAAGWRGVPQEDVLEEDRAAAKRFAYCVLFGGGTGAFAAETGCSEASAAAASEAFKRCVPGFARWRDTLVAEASRRAPPHVITLGGRRRYLPGLAARASSTFAAADARKAVNTTCQGSAADIVKRAMIDAHEKLFRDCDCDGADGGDCDGDDGVWRTLRANGCRLVLQVHDELVFELDESDAVRAVGVIRRTMERAGEAFSLRVALPVKVRVGMDYGNMTASDA